MVISCCAVGCTHRQGCKPNLAFYRIPADEDRRRRWVAAINRENWKPSKYTRICSEHFLQGEKSDDPLSPDYVPSVFDTKSPADRCALGSLQKYEVREQRKKKKRHQSSKSEAARALLDLSAEAAGPVEAEDLTPLCHSGTSDEIITYCPCGHQLSSKAAFCCSCGKDINFLCDVDKPSTIGEAPGKSVLWSFQTFRSLKEKERRVSFKKKKAPIKDNLKIAKRNLWVRRLKRVNTTQKKPRPGGGVATSGADWEPNLHHRVCGRHFITGRPNADPDHPDFGPSQHLGPKITSPAGSVKRAADKQDRYHRAVRRRRLQSAAAPEPETDIQAKQVLLSDSHEGTGTSEDVMQAVCYRRTFMDCGASLFSFSSTQDTTGKEARYERKRRWDEALAPVSCPTAEGSPLEYCEENELEEEVELTKVKHDVVPLVEPTKVKHAVVPLDHDYAGQPPTGAVEKVLEKIKELEERLKKNTRVQAPLSRFCVSDEDFMFYTRFSSEHSFMFFWNSIEPSAFKAPHWNKAQKLGMESVFQETANPPCKLHLIDEFFLYCLRTAAGLNEKVLATMFGLNVCTVNRMLITWANYLYLVLGSIPVWMTRDQVRRAMSRKFQRTCPRVRVILDCFALQCESPASNISRSETDSTDKFQTTYKGLVGVSPSGQVSFVSALNKGSISNKELTRLSGIVHLLEQGDEVMAGKDFLIEDLLATVGAKQVPPQFLLKDKEKPLEMAHPIFKRITCKVKMFHIFDCSIPLNLAGCINQIWVNSCLLLNYLGPMELDDKQ